MKKLNLLALSVKSALFAGAITSFAGVAAEEEKNNAEDEEIEKVVVTGSRIRKAEFSSASPIQVVSGDLSREMGLFDAGKMLQSTNQAAGLQIDNSFGGFVLDNGPGAATIGYRGLGASRTLVLINGRRMAPAGVGGAPTSPDLNLIPGVMVNRVDNLFDGASTVYGSDAIAGVANVILREDVEGFEFQGGYSSPASGGGEEATVSAMYGKTFDNGFVTVGVEYVDTQRQSFRENEFMRGCDERLWKTQDGRVINRNAGYGPVAGGEDTCDINPLNGRILVPFWGNLFHTPGSSNVNVNNWSAATIGASSADLVPNSLFADYDGDGIPDGYIIDGNGDGLRDVNYHDPKYSHEKSDRFLDSDFIGQNERISLMVNGEYNFQDENDTSLYYEGLYASRDSNQVRGGSQFFPVVPASNYFNPCGEYGSDCANTASFGGMGPRAAQTVISIIGDRDRAEVEVEQYRLVTGVTGNLAALENIGLNNWYYDVYASYSASTGTDSRIGIHRTRLAQSLDTTVAADGTVSCTDTSGGCVPVNLFADALYASGGGRLAAEEEAFLFAERFMETKVNQTMFSAFVGGDFFELPWNNEAVSGVVGFEYRRDEIESNPNDVTSQGLLMHYFVDEGADGSRNLKELFTEIDLPLLKGAQFAEELSMTVGYRITDESFYDASSTYSVKGVYRPVEWFTLRGTQGTSYRAPNLRERFLNGTTGFNDVSDPCTVPTDARTTDANGTITYNPAEDGRDSEVLAACVAGGVDPLSLGLGEEGGVDSFNPLYNIEISSGGSTALTEETSTSRTLGFIFEQPFTDAFELTISATRFDIEIENSVAEPGYDYSVNQCYLADGNRAFCDRITRADSGRISLVDESFINIGLETSRGVDYNIYYEQDFSIGEEAVGVSFDLQATRMSERVTDVLGSIDDDVGEASTPEWRGTARMQLRYSDFRFNWETRYIGEGESDTVTDWENDASLERNRGCRGLYNDDGSPLRCAPVNYTEDYMVHNMGFTYDADSFLVSFGVRNVFNDEPPKVDGGGIFSRANVPLGVGYDLFGRTPYINIRAQF